MYRILKSSMKISFVETSPIALLFKPKIRSYWVAGGLLQKRGEERRIEWSEVGQLRHCTCPPRLQSLPHTITVAFHDDATRRDGTVWEWHDRAGGPRGRIPLTSRTVSLSTIPILTTHCQHLPTISFICTVIDLSSADFFHGVFYLRLPDNLNTWSTYLLFETQTSFFARLV